MPDIRVIISNFSRRTSLREMEHKLKLSRRSLTNYIERAEASDWSMMELLVLNDVKQQVIMPIDDGHRGNIA